MKTIKKYSVLIFMMIMLFTYSTNSQTWEEIGFNLPGGDSATFSTLISFTNKDTGWVFTHTSNTYKLFKTTTGGENWQKIKTLNGDFSAYFATAIFSKDPDFFYMMNSDNNPTVGNFARFTSDGGISWDSTELFDEGFKIINFYSEEKGIALNNSNSWITTDKGRTWLRKGEVGIEKGIYFYNEKIGWMVGEGPYLDGGHISKTTDGGITWVYSTKDVPPLTGITFIDSLKGFAVGVYWNYYKTTDSGKNWQMDTTFKVGGFDIDFLDNKNGWISGWGQIQKTTDGGESWENQFDNFINYQLVKLLILKEDKVAYVLGVNPDDNAATLLKADLSNITDIEENKEAIPNKFYLYQNYPNPFNPTTIINYELPVTCFVNLTIYDLLGREVDVLVDEEKKAGLNKILWKAKGFSSGIYIAKLTAGRFVKSIKLILLK